MANMFEIKIYMVITPCYYQMTCYVWSFVIAYAQNSL